MCRDGPVHRVANGRIAAALDAASQSTAEVAFTMDIVHLARIAMNDEVASCEGAVLDSLVSDMERYLVVVECTGVIAGAVECREADRLAFVRYCMHHVPLDGKCCACKVAGEAESLMHFDNRCVVAQNRWTRDSCALREADRAHPFIQMVIVIRMGRVRRGYRYDR